MSRERRTERERQEGRKGQETACSGRGRGRRGAASWVRATGLLSLPGEPI